MWKVILGVLVIVVVAAGFAVKTGVILPEDVLPGSVGKSVRKSIGIGGEPCFEVQEECLDYIRDAAEQGIAKEQFSLGVMYATGEGVSKDYREVARWFLEAAKQGNVVAQFNLGVMYYDGNGIERDVHEAYIWFLIAGASGVENAGKAIKVMTQKSVLTPEQIESAKKEAKRRFKEIAAK